MCGPPLLPFDGVQTVKAWRQPVNFPCCDSTAARGHAIFPRRHRQAYIPLMRMFPALLSAAAYLSCTSVLSLRHARVCSKCVRVGRSVTGLIRAGAGRRTPAMRCSGRPPVWFNLQLDLIIVRDCGKLQFGSVTSRHYYSQQIRKCSGGEKKERNTIYNRPPHPPTSCNSSLREICVGVASVACAWW